MRILEHLVLSTVPIPQAPHFLLVLLLIKLLVQIEIFDRHLVDLVVLDLNEALNPPIRAPLLALTLPPHSYLSLRSHAHHLRSYLLLAHFLIGGLFQNLHPNGLTPRDLTNLPFLGYLQGCLPF